MKIILEGRESEMPCPHAEAILLMNDGTDLDWLSSLGVGAAFITSVQMNPRDGYWYVRYELHSSRT